jgi:hypothetical protein
LGFRNMQGKLEKPSALRIPITILIRILEITAHLCTVLYGITGYEVLRPGIQN